MESERDYINFMPTSIIQRGLELFVEASELAGADGSSVTSWTDLSGNGRHLTGSSNYPVIKTNAINSKKSVVWNGSKNPLGVTSAFTIRCGFMVVKIGATFTDFAGLLTGKTLNPILVGLTGTSGWYDFGYRWYEYRLNDRIANGTNVWTNGQFTRYLSAPAPVGNFGIIFFKIWNNMDVSDIQIGKDRDLLNRFLNAEVSLGALYSRDLDHTEIRTITESIAYSYQLPIADKFPAHGSKGDPHTIGKQIISDGQFDPNVRIKSNLRNSFEGKFSIRSMEERNKVLAFFDAKYPDKNFLYTNCNIVPPEETVVRFPPQNFQIGENLNQTEYAASFTETSGNPDYYVPSVAPTINY